MRPLKSRLSSYWKEPKFVQRLGLFVAQVGSFLTRRGTLKHELVRLSSPPCRSLKLANKLVVINYSNSSVMTRHVYSFYYASVPSKIFLCSLGLGHLADTLTNIDVFPYGDIPHFPVSTVASHASQMVFGLLNGVEVMVMKGRIHYYEGCVERKRSKTSN